MRGVGGEEGIDDEVPNASLIVRLERLERVHLE